MDGAAQFVDGAVLHPWSDGAWELTDLSGIIRASWPRASEPQRAPLWWQRPTGGHMVAWGAGDGLRLGPWRRNLYRLNLSDQVVGGPVLSQQNRRVFVVTADDVIHALDPMALQVAWRQAVPGWRALSEDRAGFLPILTSRQLIGLDAASGAVRWSVPAQAADSVQSLHDPSGRTGGLLVHASTGQGSAGQGSAGQGSAGQVMLRQPDTGDMVESYQGDLVAASWQGADPHIITKQNGKLSGWVQGALRWQSDITELEPELQLGPDPGLAASISWVSQPDGIFAVLADGRWIFYSIPVANNAVQSDRSD